MARHLHRLGTLTILNGQTDSAAYTVASVLGLAIDFVFYAPATLPETVNIQIAPNDAPAAGDWKVLQIPAGTDFVIAAGKAATMAAAGFKALRLHATGAVGADRVFEVIAQLDSTGMNL